jgi:hypothetical protein
LSDASSYENNPDIDDFAAEFGGPSKESGGIKGFLKTFRACQRTHERVHRIFTDEEISQLRLELAGELFGHYFETNGDLTITRNYPCDISTMTFDEVIDKTIPSYSMNRWRYWDDNNKMLTETGVSAGLTSSPVLVCSPDDLGPKSRASRGWWYKKYQVNDPVTRLREYGRITFDSGWDGRESLFKELHVKVNYASILANRKAKEVETQVSVELWRTFDAEDGHKGVNQRILKMDFPLVNFGPLEESYEGANDSAIDFIGLCEGFDGEPMVRYLLLAALNTVPHSYARKMECDGNICKYSIKPILPEVREAFVKAGYTEVELDAMYEYAKEDK